MLEVQRWLLVAHAALWEVREILLSMPREKRRDELERVIESANKTCDPMLVEYMERTAREFLEDALDA